MIKKTQVKELEHHNYKGKTVPVRSIDVIASVRFREEQQMQIFLHLYDMGMKNEQDIFLPSLIEPKEIK
ncbi:hypothetical protein PR048_000963 [Dryococelus australis]|uniref:Uncharacterized protein n=1 Tax=Dryococelus australis TaxID=614101 RepID=A0ABQ9IGN1_9NEOP|nr:hypothetical protein PR048_000963 [Dryococelus australis]